MKHLLLIFSLLTFSIFTISQDLSKKIDEDVNLMLRLNGGKTLQSVSEEELEQSRLFDLLVKEFFRGKQEIKELNELGVDYSEPMYIVNELTEDVSIYYFTFKIKNIGIFKNFAKSLEQDVTVEESNDLNYIAYNKESRLYWNDTYALYITGDYIGYEYSSYGGYEWGAEKSEETIYLQEKEAVEEVPTQEMTEEEYQEYLREQERIRKEKEEERRKREEERERKRKEKRQKRQEIISKAVEKRAQLFFSDGKLNDNHYFKFEYLNEADAQFWYANKIIHYGRSRYNRYRRPVLPLFGLGYFFGFSNTFNGDFSSSLFLEEDQIRLESSIHYANNLVDAYKAILSQKIDGQMAKLISEDDLGYASFASSTEEILNHYPDILQETYSIFDSTNQEEFQYLADLFNIIIDEDRISEVITGDVTFVLNDLSEKEVDYYTYEYNENYQSKRVKKTRKELLPEFSIFVGCKDESLISRSIDIGMKRGWLEYVGKGFHFIDEDSEFPFELYFAYNKDIFTITTSEDRMNEYYGGKVNNKISSDKKRLVKSNSAGFYLNLQTLVDRVLLSSDMRKDERSFYTSIQDDLTDVYAEMNYKNGKAKIKAHTKVPESSVNSAKYVLNLIDELVAVEDDY